jgi:CRP/FNR family transcriptional regulator, cyclic AMP receptor protein
MKQAKGLGQSFLDTLEPSMTDAIRQRAVVHHHRRGDVIVSEADGHWTGIVLSGMARVFLRTESGRQVTIRHVRRGATIGIGALLGEGSVSAQAVTACAVMRLDHDQVLRLARAHPALALAIAREISTVLLDTHREIVIREQGSVRQRIARQLLTFGGEFDPEEPLVVPLSHEDLADSVGSAREVVTRQLARFQADGLVVLDRGQITLVDPVGLHEVANPVDRSAA